MKFNVGDLVSLNKASTIYGILPTATNIGIIATKAVLMYVHDWEVDGCSREYWAYDILMGEHRFVNVPEEVLEKFENDDEENS